VRDQRVLVEHLGLADHVAKLLEAPYFDRYSLLLVAGFAGLLGIAASARPTLGLSLLLVFVLQICTDFIRYINSSFVTEPSTSYQLSTNASAFMRRYASMSEFDQEVPIVLLDSLDFLPTIHYSPFYLMREGDINGSAYLKLKAC
jgi:hypothetical protein